LGEFQRRCKKFGCLCGKRGAVVSSYFGRLKVRESVDYCIRGNRESKGRYEILQKKGDPPYWNL
jgi:hypothetical protein